MALPAFYSKGADAVGRSNSQYRRKSISFDVDSFNKTVCQVETLVKAGPSVNPMDFYPRVKDVRGNSRDLPMVDNRLREALADYISFRLDRHGPLKRTDPLFKTQNPDPCSPNTLQEHMALTLRNWAGIEKASSRSGRRSVITNVSHKQKKSVKVAQKIAGPANAADDNRNAAENVRMLLEMTARAAQNRPRLPRRARVVRSVAGGARRRLAADQPCPRPWTL